MNLHSLYGAMETDRSAFLERAYRSALLTIPGVLPREGVGRGRLPQNYQSVGSRGVNNLSSKLMLTLFPNNLPFYRLSIDPFAERELTAQFGGDELKTREAVTEITKNLSLIEETGRLDFETSGWRPVVSEMIQHLVVAGNGLIMDDPKRGPQFIDFRKFVCERDPEGNLQKAIIRQQISRDLVNELFGPLPEKTANDFSQQPGISAPEASKFYKLYTGAIRRPDGRFDVWQQIGEDYIVPNSARTYTKETLPIIPLRFRAISGENYGAGYVEDYDGDLLALEMLSRSLTEGALAAAKFLVLVRGGASTRPKTISSAPNGAVRQGDIDDVGIMKVEKTSDFAFANQRAATLEQRLQFAFLMVTQRNAERVTAEEVRFVAQELEDALGGVYASLAESMQRPIVDYFLARLNRRNDIPRIPDSINPVISTGLEAISRGHSAQRLTQLGGIAQQILGPEMVSQIMDPHAVMKQLAISLNLDPDKTLRSQDEITQAAQEQQAQALTETVGPEVIRAATNNQ